MHIDPIATDAFNGLIQGHKWWMVLPIDLYEFKTDLSCDEDCSDLVRLRTADNNTQFDNGQTNRLWIQHVLPQIR